MIKSAVGVGVCVVFLLSGCKRNEPSTEEQQTQVGAETGKASGVFADLKPTQGSQAMGHLNLSAEKGGVRIRGTVSNLANGSTHGFHVHEKGDCSAPDAKSAGEHMNPEHRAHGRAESGEHHMGDMDNLVADSKGVATVDIFIKGATLADGSQDDLIGKAFIVHASPDDYKTQPSGGSGPRIACGVIAKK